MTSTAPRGPIRGPRIDFLVVDEVFELVEDLAAVVGGSLEHLATSLFGPVRSHGERAVEREQLRDGELEAMLEDDGDPRVRTRWSDGLELVARPNPDDVGFVRLAERLGYGLRGVEGARRLTWWLTRDHELAHAWSAHTGGAIVLGTRPPGPPWSPSMRCAAMAVVEERPPGRRCPHDGGHAEEEAAVIDLQAHLVGVWGPTGPRPWERCEVEAPTRA